jgi:transposase|tara:strand:- start:709 stop:1755 length:1047 start_codon:yes stop_codon:yes gene_type:complete
MRFYNTTHQHYCGIDLHAKSMYVCIINHDGETVLHCNMKTEPEHLATAIEPYRQDLVISVECLFTWYWLADWCAKENIPFVLGHALYMKAIHGGKAKNDRIDSEKIARLLKAGMVPQAYAYPAKMRATRDLLRRRIGFARQRADLIAHIQNTVSQYNLPPLGVRLGRKKDRLDIADHFPDPVVRQMVELDLNVIDHLDEQLRVLEQDLVLKAKAHDAGAYHLLRTVPGIGRILAMVILYEIEDIGRFPTLGQFVSYSRLVKCSRESAGKKSGYSGKKIGNAYLKWAFSEAAVLFLRGNPPAQNAIARVASKHGKGKALSILAHRLGRAVYVMLNIRQPFDEERFMKTL